MGKDWARIMKFRNAIYTDYIYLQMIAIHKLENGKYNRALQWVIEVEISVPKAPNECLEKSETVDFLIFEFFSFNGIPSPPFNKNIYTFIHSPFPF